MRVGVLAVLGCALWLVAAAPASAATIAGSDATSAGVPGSVSAKAAVTGTTAGGFVKFSLYGPNTGCQGLPYWTSDVPAYPDGTVPSGDSTTLTKGGTYKWVAEYIEGDTVVVKTDCDAPGMTSVVSKRVPVLGPSLPVTASAGQSISQTQSFTGAFSPTGSFVFDLYGPDDTNCVRPRIFSSARTVTAADSSFTSDPFTVTTAGVYRWKATYSGDEKNEAVVATSCVAVPPASADKTRPTLSTPSLLPSRFKAGGKTTIRYSLSEAATVVFGVEQARPGRRSGRRCVAPTAKNRTKKKCTRYVTLKGSFSQKGKKGSNRLTFNGKLRKRKLAPGSYRLRAVATDAARNKSAVKRRGFRILR
jgi:hypothetical protein